MSRRGWLRTLGYLAYALLALCVSLYATLPVEAIAQRLAHEVQRGSGGAWTLAYEDPAAWRLSGLSLGNVRLRRARGEQPPEVLGLDGVRVRVQLLPLLVARLSLAWELAQGEGRLRGVFAPGRAGAFHLEAEASAWGLAEPPVLADLVGLPAAGALGGHLEVFWEPDLRRAAGRGEVMLAKLALGPGTVGGIGLPKVGLGDLEISFELKDGRFKVASLRQVGGNLNLQGRAAVALKEPLATSGLELCFMLRLDAAFLAANPKLRSAMQLAEMQLKRDGDGFLHVPVGGSLAAPRLGGGMCR